MDLKKKIIISLISFWGIGIILAFVFAGILVLQRNLSIPKVQASPGPACQVPDNLEVTKGLKVSNFTNSKLVAPEYWDFSSWNGGGETADFTLNTTYGHALVAIQIDAQTDWEEIIFYDGAGGSGNEVASAEWKNRHYDWKQGQMHVVLLPTNVKSVKINARGGFGGEQANINLVVITYIP